MTTLTIKIDKQTKAGKAFLAMSEAFLNGVEGIEIIKSEPNDTIYNTEMVKKIKKAEENIQNGNTTRLNPNDIWGSIL